MRQAALQAAAETVQGRLGGGNFGGGGGGGPSKVLTLTDSNFKSKVVTTLPFLNFKSVLYMTCWLGAGA